MRTLSGPEATLLDGPRYGVWIRVWVENISSTLVNYVSAEGKNWVDHVDFGGDIDQPIAGATITLRREIDHATDILSLSPLMDGSELNTSGPAIDIGRAIKIEVATVAIGATPSGGDWKNVFEGEIDDVEFARSPMTISVRDKGGILQDRFVETETPYGAVDGSVEAEEVIQAILDDFSTGVTLVTPVSPSFAIKPYKQSRQPIMEASNTIASLFGWDTRYRWGGSAWEFQMKDPDRAKTTPDRTIGPDRYTDVTQLKLSRTDVRNVIWLWYTDATTGIRTKIEREDATSISRYGRRWGEIDLAASSPIDTAAEAEALADIVISDLKDPKADQSIEMLFDWSVELNDLYRFVANGVHYDVDQDWAVVGYSHRLSMQEHRTTLHVRGKPAGKYLGWVKMMNDPNQRPANAGPTLIVNAVVSATEAVIDVEHTGILTLSIDGGLTFDDPTVTPGITEYPVTVARPDGTAGLAAFRWVFKASLNGQEVTHPVDIPPTVAPEGTKTPPDGAYGTVGPNTTVVAIHAGYGASITLTALPSARTELDEGTRFRLDATNYAKCRVTGHVKTIGFAGSVLGLEYFDGAVWVAVGPTEPLCPIDALGTQTSAIVDLSTDVTGDLVFRVVTQGGNASTTPVLGNVHVHFIGYDAAEVARAGILYLRELTPSSAPSAGDFYYSEIQPTHDYGEGTDLTDTADTVRALRSEKGTDTTNIHLQFSPTDTHTPRDLLGGIFATEPFAIDQSVAIGPWELVMVAERLASNDYAIPQMSVVLLRNVASVWTRITTIVDQHSLVNARNFALNTQRVSRFTVQGAAFDALEGDVIALEVWVHYEKDTSYATGHALPGFPDTLAGIGYDGATDIPLGTADGGAWPVGAYPASYLKPPISLALGGGGCMSPLSGVAIGADFDMGLCDVTDLASVEAMSQQLEDAAPDYGNLWPGYVSGKRISSIQDVTVVEDPTAANGARYLLLDDLNTAPLGIYQNITATFPVDTFPDFWLGFVLRDIAMDIPFGLSTTPFFAGVSFELQSGDSKIHLRDYSTVSDPDTVTALSTGTVDPADLMEFAYHVRDMVITDVPGSPNQHQYACVWDMYVRNRTTSVVDSVLGIVIEEYATPIDDDNGNAFTEAWVLALMNQYDGGQTQVHGWKFVNGATYSDPFGMGGS